jgi:hypothetical protein
MKKTLFLVSVSAFLSFAISCGKSDNTGQEKGNIDRNFCFITDKTMDEDVKKCKDGATVVYISPQWGKDLTPLLGALFFCDLDKSVVYTGAGLVCKFDKSKTEKRQELMEFVEDVYRKENMFRKSSPWNY